MLVPTVICAMFADDGNEFYIDAKTKQRTSQRPEEEAWISLYDEERERTYYLNELTNVSCCAVVPLVTQVLLCCTASRT